MITSKNLEQLSNYKKLNKVQQIMVKKRKNVKEINHCLTVIKNTDYALWLSQTDTYYLNRLLIEEIIKNDL